MRLILLSSAVLAAACAPSTTVERSPAPETVRVVGGATGSIAMGMSASPTATRATPLSAAMVEVWRVLPAAYQALEIPISTIDSMTRQVGNSGFNVRRRLGTIPMVRLIDCGSTQGGPSAESYDIRLSVLTQVRATDAGSTIVTTVDAMGKPVAFSGEYIRCSSNGVLETRLADAVKSRLGK